MNEEPIPIRLPPRRDTAGTGESLWRDTRRNVEINVGKVCNNKCVFCLDGLPATDLRRYMPWPEMQSEIRRWHEAGTRSLGFLGGEPTTYPFILEGIRYARDLGYTRIALATNGTKLYRTDFADQLLDAGLTRVTISMHGHRPELEDRLTRVPGNFLKKRAGIEYLIQKRDAGLLRDNVSVNIVLNGWNHRYLPQMLAFFYGLGLDDVRANFVRVEGYAEDEPSLIPRLTDAVPSVVRAILLNEYKYHRTFTVGGVPLCVLPWELLASKDLSRRVIGEFRDLDTDCSISAAETTPREDGVARIEGGRARFNWQERKKRDLKTPVPACSGCRYAGVCEGVWRGYLAVHGDREFATIP